MIGREIEGYSYNKKQKLVVLRMEDATVLLVSENGSVVGTIGARRLRGCVRVCIECVFTLFAITCTERRTRSARVRV